MGDFGDIDGAMVDLHRTVHVQINHCNIIVIFFIMQMLFFIMQMIWSIRPTRCLRGLSTSSRFSLSLVNFMLEQRKMTREIGLRCGATENSERICFCLMWNSFICWYHEILFILCNFVFRFWGQPLIWKTQKGFHKCNTVQCLFSTVQWRYCFILVGKSFIVTVHSLQ